MHWLLKRESQCYCMPSRKSELSIWGLWFVARKTCTGRKSELSICQENVHRQLERESQCYCMSVTVSVSLLPCKRNAIKRESVSLHAKEKVSVRCSGCLVCCQKKNHLI